jgi:hypothetical protein
MRIKTTLLFAFFTITIGNAQNLALNKTAYQSSDNGLNVAAPFAFDGNINTRWESIHGVDPQWLYVDLGEPCNITGVKLEWEGAFGENYTIDVSDDGVTWTTVKTVVGGDGLTDDLTFPTVVGSYVRMHGTKRGMIYGYSLWEFEVKGTPVSLGLETSIKQEADISVSPNPTSGIVNINTSSNVDQAEVFEISGKRVLKTKSNTVNLSELTNGVYILKVKTNGVVKTTRIIKQ